MFLGFDVDSYRIVRKTRSTHLNSFHVEDVLLVAYLACIQNVVESGSVADHPDLHLRIDGRGQVELEV